MIVKVGDTVRCRLFVGGHFVGEAWDGKVLNIGINYLMMGNPGSILTLAMLVVQTLIPRWLNPITYEVSRDGYPNMLITKKEILEVIAEN